MVNCFERYLLPKPKTIRKWFPNCITNHLPLPIDRGPFSLWIQMQPQDSTQHESQCPPIRSVGDRAAFQPKWPWGFSRSRIRDSRPDHRDSECSQWETEHKRGTQEGSSVMTSPHLQVMVTEVKVWVLQWLKEAKPHKHLTHLLEPQSGAEDSGPPRPHQMSPLGQLTCRSSRCLLCWGLPHLFSACTPPRLCPAWFISAISLMLIHALPANSQRLTLLTLRHSSRIFLFNFQHCWLHPERVLNESHIFLPGLFIFIIIFTANSSKSATLKVPIHHPCSSK